MYKDILMCVANLFEKEHMYFQIPTFLRRFTILKYVLNYFFNQIS